MKKLIIWLFEKYAYNDWLNLQLKADQQSVSDQYEIPFEKVNDFVAAKQLEEKKQNHALFQEQMENKQIRGY